MIQIPGPQDAPPDLRTPSTDPDVLARQVLNGRVPALSTRSYVGFALAVSSIPAILLLGPLNLLLAVPGVVLSVRGLRAEGAHPVPVLGFAAGLVGVVLSAFALVVIAWVLDLVRSIDLAPADLPPADAGEEPPRYPSPRMR